MCLLGKSEFDSSSDNPKKTIRPNIEFFVSMYTKYSIFSTNASPYSVNDIILI